jgi:hypothetical protein
MELYRVFMELHKNSLELYEAPYRFYGVILISMENSYGALKKLYSAPYATFLWRNSMEISMNFFTSVLFSDIIKTQLCQLNSFESDLKLITIHLW